MPNEKKKRQTPDKELDALRDLLAHPTPEAKEALRAALQKPRALVVARAAHLIKEKRLPGLEKELVGAFERFLQDPIKSDPGCLAKLAALEALDFIEHDDPAPFLVAARHIQEEKAWGPKVDTAGGLRARAIVALARLNYPSLSLLAAELLADPEAPVRQATVEALCMSGNPGNAALLLYKLRVGDKEPLILLACMGGLLSLVPEWGVSTLQALLSGEDEALRDMAAISLGESRRDDALRILLQSLEGLVLSVERAVLLRALGLHRSEGALAVLLRIVAEGSAADARAALEALSARRFEPEVKDRAQAALRSNQKIDLRMDFAKAFSTDSR